MDQMIRDTFGMLNGLSMYTEWWRRESHLSSAKFPDPTNKYKWNQLITYRNHTLDGRAEMQDDVSESSKLIYKMANAEIN